MLPVLGDINLLVTTDVHSWLEGHLHADRPYGEDERTDATFGDLVSTLDHLRATANAARTDLWLLDNGDVVDGTGLSAATAVPGSAVFPLLASMPYNAFNMGNHELYHSETVERDLLGSGFVASRNGTYLTSNVELAASGAPVGSRYTLLEGRHGSRLLVLGFLYNMRDACDAVHVTAVEDAVQAPWFAHAMRIVPTVDAVIVLAHMHFADPLVKKILAAIRSAAPAASATVPVQFLTGHSHIRASAQLDPHASTFEAGKYADTLGFVSFNVTRPHWRRVEDRLRGPYNHDLDRDDRLVHTTFRTFENTTRFVHLQLPMRRKSLARFAGVSMLDFTTPAGHAMAIRIQMTRQALGLSRVLGCTRKSYDISLDPQAEGSAWGLYLKSVAPDHMFSPPRNSSQWFVSSTGALRYGIHAGNVSVDDVYCVLPFVDTLRIARRIKGSTLVDALRALREDMATKKLVDPLKWFDQMDKLTFDGHQLPLEEMLGVGQGLMPGEILGTFMDNLWGVSPGLRPRVSSSASLPSFVSTSDVGPDLEPNREYDALFGTFDEAKVVAAIQAAQGGKSPQVDVYAIVQSDTQTWMKWAHSLPMLC